MLKKFLPEDSSETIPNQRWLWDWVFWGSPISIPGIGDSDFSFWAKSEIPGNAKSRGFRIPKNLKKKNF